MSEQTTAPAGCGDCGACPACDERLARELVRVLPEGDRLAAVVRVYLAAVGAPADEGAPDAAG